VGQSSETPNQLIFLLCFRLNPFLEIVADTVYVSNAKLGASLLHLVLLACQIATSFVLPLPFIAPLKLLIHFYGSDVVRLKSVDRDWGSAKCPGSVQGPIFYT
jgi:hypothetical protein